MSISGDKRVIKDLLSRVEEIASLHENDVKRALWLKANSLKPEDRKYRPPVFNSIHGFQGDFEGGYLPVPELLCENPDFRDYELQLRYTLYRHQLIPDDVPVEKPVYRVEKVVTGRWDWGVVARTSERPVKGGAWKFDPVITQKSQLDQMKFPTVMYDEEESEARHKKAAELFGDLVDVKLTYSFGWPSFHLMGEWCRLRGLEQIFIDMYDDPQFLHAAMQFLAEGNRRTTLQMEELGLLAHGGIWVRAEDLPQPSSSEPIRLKDIFTFVEAQELTLVSPKMHKEFALQYEKPLAELCGLSTYGCCEDLTNKLDDLFEIENLRQVGITAWADTEKCAEKINAKYSISWRPNPADLAGDFNTEYIRDYLRKNLESLKRHNCACHVFLKDIHSCGGVPERFTEWTRICLEEIDRLWG